MYIFLYLKKFVINEWFLINFLEGDILNFFLEFIFSNLIEYFLIMLIELEFLFSCFILNYRLFFIFILNLFSICIN